MHLQGRSHTTHSPADMLEFLQTLASLGGDPIAFGGSNIEKGGEIAFALPEDGDAAETLIAALQNHEPPYPTARLLNAHNGDFDLIEKIPKNISGLHAKLVDIHSVIHGNERVIVDILIGSDPAEPELWFAQIYSEPKDGSRPGGSDARSGGAMA